MADGGSKGLHAPRRYVCMYVRMDGGSKGLDAPRRYDIDT
jgi:hypothetical protein